MKTYTMPLPPRPTVARAPGAPATTVGPSIATEYPSWSPAAPSEAVSSAVWVAFFHFPEAGCVNRYTAPLPRVAADPMTRGADSNRRAGDRDRVAELVAVGAVRCGQRGAPDERVDLKRVTGAAHVDHDPEVSPPEREPRVQWAPAGVGGCQPFVAQDIPPIYATEHQAVSGAGKHRSNVTGQRNREGQRSPAAAVQRVRNREPLLDAEGPVEVPLAQCPAPIPHEIRACLRARVGRCVQRATIASACQRHPQLRATHADTHARTRERDPHILRGIDRV